MSGRAFVGMASCRCIYLTRACLHSMCLAAGCSWMCECLYVFAEKPEQENEHLSSANASQHQSLASEPKGPRFDDYLDVSRDLPMASLGHM